MIVSLIAAVTENNVIGKENKLLWHLPADMKFFKNTTWGFPIIMGRKTFDSFGTALPGRTNIVITRSNEWKAADAFTADNLNEAMILAESLATKEVFIIGGGQIYTEAINIASRIYLTRVHATLDGDAYFPEIGENWMLQSNHFCAKDSRHNFDFSFQIWEKNSKQMV